MDFLSLTLEELETELEKTGQPKFRAKQIFEWLHVKKVSDFADMTNLPADLREKLPTVGSLKSLRLQKALVSNRGDTVKYLYELQDGNTIETVLMSHRHGNSLCISSQVGCRMGCKFCASGIGGLVRNLEPSEMLLQVYETIRSGKTVDSIVIMGIGEPLDNFTNLLKFLDLLQSGHGMSLRHVSLSTCGLVPQIDELAKLKLGLTLSVSLHAVTDEERSAIMPINRMWGIDELLKSCRNYFKATGRRISFEYALIDGVNDSETHAIGLYCLFRDARIPPQSFHVNLIPVNEVRQLGFKQSKNAKVFRRVLEKFKIHATVRRTMGADISAACGQLRGNKAALASFDRS